MVQFKNIIKAMENYVTKCPTIAEMRQKLAELSYDERFNQLKEQSLLNPLEERDYDLKMGRWESIQRFKESNREQYESEEWIREEEQEIEEELFQYSRRLIEGLKTQPIPQVSLDKFKSDSKRGELEKSQIRSQQENVTVDTSMEGYTDEYGHYYERYIDQRLMAMDDYFNGDVQGINYWLSHKGYINKLEKEQQKDIKDIDSLMSESEGLTQDTMLYRGGYWDIHLKPGDHSKGFKGYQSTTFQKETAGTYVEWANEEKGDNNMLIQILAPKGTKGIVGNDDRFNNGEWEHEYVLPRNTGYTVVDVDYDNMVATILLDEP